MTSVDILYHYATPPTQQISLALAAACKVYVIRRFTFDRAAQTLAVEYDATRLTAAAVTRLILQAGLQVEELAAIAPPEPQPQPAAVA